MARLPVPGSDDGSWGSILNDFLAQSHNSDGTIKSSSISSAQILDNTVSEAKLDSALQAKVNSAAGVTDLSTTASATTVSVFSSTGNDAVLQAATTGAAGVLTAADKTKLDGVQDRANHTGSQAISTVSGLQTALNALVHSYATAAAGSMFVVNESGGGYTRPSARTDIVFVFTGVSDPGSTALENDRWERLS